MKFIRTHWIKLLGAGALVAVVYFGWQYARAYETRLLALDAKTGHMEWSTPLETGDFSPTVGAKNGRVFAYSMVPFSEPLSPEDREFMQKNYGKEVVRTIQLQAFDNTTGRQLWKYVFDPTDFVIDETKSITKSPVMSENWVAIRLNEHTLAVLDASSGSLLWHFDQADSTYSGQPTIFAGDRLITISENSDGSECSVQALDARTGTPVWKASPAYLCTAIFLDKPAITKSEQLAFVSSLLSVRAFDLSSGDFRFDVEADSDQLQLVGNILYINAKNKLLAVDATTGAPRWTFEVPVSGQHPQLFGLQATDKVVYIANVFQDGEKGIWLYALNAFDGRELWRKQLNQKIEGVATLGLTLRDTAINPEAFFTVIDLANEGYPHRYMLTALSAVDGTKLWGFPIHFDGSLVAEADLILVIDTAPRWRNWLAHVNPAWYEG